MAWKKLYIQPNKAAQKAAKRGLEARKKAPKSKKGGLDAVQASMAGVGSGVLRARDIVAGKRVNAYQVNAFFNRHLKNYVNASIEGLKPVESRAIQAWLLWGGEPLRKQAAAAVRKDKTKRNPVENTSRDPARMSDEDLQVELDSAVGRVDEAVHQTEWEQEPEYVLGYTPSGTVIYKSSPDERFPRTLEGPPHDYTPEQYRERLRRDYDIFQEILRRPHLSVIDIESQRFLRGKSSGDEDLKRYVDDWRDEQVGLAWYERDRGNKELQARQEASAIMEGRSSKQIRYNEYLKERFAQLPHVRYDAFDDSSRSNPIARSVARRNRRAKGNPMPPMREYDPWTMFLFMKAGEKDVLTLPGGGDDLMHRKIIDEADLLDYDINYLHDADGRTTTVINLPTGPARLKAKRFMEIWETKWQDSPEDYEETDEDWIEMGFLLDYDKTQTLQKVGRIGKRRAEEDERLELDDAIDQTCKRKAYKERAFDTNEKFSLDDLLTADKAVPQRLEDMKKAQGAYCDAENRFQVIFDKLSSEDKEKAFKMVGAESNPIARSVARRNRKAKRNPMPPMRVYDAWTMFLFMKAGEKDVLTLHDGGHDLMQRKIIDEAEMLGYDITDLYDKESGSSTVVVNLPTPGARLKTDRYMEIWKEGQGDEMQTEEEYIEMGFLLDYDKNQTLQNLGRIGKPLSEKYRQEAEDAHDQMCLNRFKEEGDHFDANKEFSVNDFVSAIKLREDAEAGLRKSLNDGCDAAIKFNSIANKLSSEDQQKAFELARAERNPIARSVAKRNRRAKRNPIETRNLTDDEIEDQMAAIGCLIEKSARSSDDYPHEAERSLPQTRRVWGLYKSLEKEKDGRRAERNPIFDKVPDNVRDPMLYRKARAKVKSRVNVWPSVHASGQLVQEYKRMGGRYINPSIDRSGKISYGEYYGLPDGDGGYDLYYKDEIIASGIDTVEQAEEEIAQHIESL